MDAWDRTRATLRRHALLTDALLALLVFVAVLFVPDPMRRAALELSVPTVALTAVACGALVFRRHRPRVVLAVTLVSSVLGLAVIGGHYGITVTALIALYTVAVHGDRRSTVCSWAVTAAAVTMASLAAFETSSLDPDVFSYIGWTGVAAAVGDSLRTRRAYVSAVEERAERAERTREEEARRRVAEERLRIARDLHDVVAHRIAVVNVQAGVASHLLSTDPAAAEEALGHVRQASRAVLDELSDILNVLRQPGDEADPTAPAPSLRQLDDLVGSFAAAGLEVDWALTGQPRALGAHVDLVAYRLLQEALTNALKHGTGTAHVVVGYQPSALALLVENPSKALSKAVRDAPTAGAARLRGTVVETGLGLVGMRERAAAVGGSVRAAAGDDGRFRVEASLPLQEISA